MPMRIILTGGGTGGHVYPLVAVAEELTNIAKQTGGSVELEFFGDGEIMKEEAAKLGVPFKNILSPKWRRYLSLYNFIDIFKFPIGFCQSFFHVWRFMPDLIFAKGGYASFLPALAGKIMMVPLVIHETDAIPGNVNRLLSRFAKKTFVAIENSKKYFHVKNIETVGNPIRNDILKGQDKSSALAFFKLAPTKPTVLFTGAGQGAQIINDTLLLSLTELTKEFQIIHQTGPKKYDEINKQVEQIIKEGVATYGPAITENYRCYPVFDQAQMAMAYTACDVIVSRSGSQIFETAAVGKPTVVVPLKLSSNNHQLANAREISKFGAIVVEEENLGLHIFVNEIKTAYNNRAELAQKIRGFAMADAASKIASQLLSDT